MPLPTWIKKTALLQELKFNYESWYHYNRIIDCSDLKGKVQSYIYSTVGDGIFYW